MKELVILYGPYGGYDEKYQGLIDEKTVCGYREYAENYGCIIYLRHNLTVHKKWEFVLPGIGEVANFCNKRKDCIIWSVKKCKIKESILPQITHPKLYYSCNNQNMECSTADINLVDTAERASRTKKSAVWFKGKNPAIWKNSTNKVYDFVLVGCRDDKHESGIINFLTSHMKEKRSILWIGGLEHQNKILPSHHNIQLTKVLTKNEMLETLPTAKIGINLTDHPTEGFPQSILEMTMCGIPTIYSASAPINAFYFNPFVILANPMEIVKVANTMINNYTLAASEQCRNWAIEHYSLEKSFKYMESLCSNIK